MELFSVREIIEYAIKIEQESFAFYTQASEIIQDADGKKLVKDLAADEVDHQNRLRHLIDAEKVSLESLNKKHEIDTTLMKRIVKTANINPDSMTMDVLKIALEREQNTEQTYTMLMTLSNLDENIIDIFDQLRLQEKGHVNKIQFRIDHTGA
ncbi:MAG: ferritin family protein [Candidatus Marinimicrobia bacterium]|nr:ferritin family protein [Candidatus Neomarinimicrobiota bacterium]